MKMLGKYENCRCIIGTFLIMFCNVFITNQSKFATLCSKRNLDYIFMLEKRKTAIMSTANIFKSIWQTIFEIKSSKSIEFKGLQQKMLILESTEGIIFCFAKIKDNLRV